ncbi:uncharacterized protein LOC126676547 isoform X2 [Mercurialis annua]|uniref:uncharacterized protein LOC126676547 isoform X2 n=1 Tax=Mercurialis annua TaxID=3986 RepID=UPI0021605CAE|nr:uncharacterized protein LOC126676547 isoform X2 [Mercurialis annua]
MSVWFLLLFTSCFSGIVIGGGVVTLESIKIYDSHEWIKTVKPIVYFSCKGEKKIEFPDVKLLNLSYTFNGLESWQPLTELTTEKCKRCGFYEKDEFKSDDVFEEWEFCPSDFDTDGRYTRSKLNQFDATFLCPQCVSLVADFNSSSGSHTKGKGMHVVLAILIGGFVSIVIIFGLLAAFKYWQKKKREQDQARFLKLFEDGDEMEDELGLGNVL